MRILHLFDHSLPEQSGYTFRSRALLLEQRSRGWETLHLTTPRHRLAGPDPETVDGLAFHRAGKAPGGPPGIAEWREVAKTAAALDALVRAQRPDILHAHSPVLNALATDRVARRHGLPWVYEIRAFWEDAAVSHGTCRDGGLRYRLSRWLETRACRRANAVACLCGGVIDDLKARGIEASKLFTVPNAVDGETLAMAPPRAPALAASLGLDGAEVIGIIGSFYDYEGLDDLVAAMPALVARRPHLHLLLVGGGPRAEALGAAAQASPVAGHIHLTGRVPHADVMRYYGLVDVLVYPRRSMRITELVTPLKPLEAMAQGKLLVASDVGGHRELINDGQTGSLFRADDAKDMVEVIDTLFEQRGSWDGRRAIARDHVMHERTWAATVDQYTPVYEKLLRQSGQNG